ncbi:hypothetical protein O181_043114 [Austropuccinia psidii MF-1]|uniref:U6 snRNA phosphodiesterase 1 n=1 Tax=Austropuccinia psidii MF-1 TaxID=1389203 RepID=A0A9Q3DHN7_9BASI|nr:hypothetical protein [Austropuccinia psidii MF-1]
MDHTKDQSSISRTEHNEATRERRKLPSPQFKNSNSTQNKIMDDDPNLHQGRKRSQAHVEGNWLTHVFIPINLNQNFQKILNAIIAKLNQIPDSKTWYSLIDDNLAAQDKKKTEISLHLSLTRPIYLKTNERREFHEQLKKAIMDVELFEIYFANCATLSNDEHTRGFLVLEVGNGHFLLMNLLERVNSILDQFCLPKYYEFPRFHISFGWCLMNPSEKSKNDIPSSSGFIPEKVLQTINDDITMNDIRKTSWEVNDVNLTIGKTTHKICLKSQT